jgi:predicted DNA-binding transcriptional regulator AlpA
MEKRLFGVKDLAVYIDMRAQTVYNKINNGTFPIPFKKVFGRIKFEKEDVDHFLNRLPLYHNVKKN